MPLSQRRRKPAGSGSLVVAAIAELALFDAESPANRPGAYQEARRESWSFQDREGAFSAEELERSGDRFEARWARLQEEGEVLVWRAGSGVYRVVVRVLPETPRRSAGKGQRADFLGGSRAPARLICPSGRLAVACLKDLGAAAAEAARVKPGPYRVGLRVDDAQRARHLGLADPALYPAGDGPDFTILLRREPR